MYTAEQLAGSIQISSWRIASTNAQPGFAVVGRLLEVVAPQPWLPLSRPLDAQIARLWLLPDVYQRLQAGMDEFLTELRSAVALFGHFAGLDFDCDEGAGVKLDSYIRWVQQVLLRHHGALMHVTLGEKGNFFYATFGAPLGHERDLANALAAALVLREPPAEFAWLEPSQIGITRGTMRAGAYGGKTRRTYGVLGDEVNLAARLMMSAQPNQILVTERIVAQAANEYEFDEVGALALKGKRELVPAFALRGRVPPAALPTQARHAAATNDTGIVGREAERRVLYEHLDALKNHGRGGVVLIEGEPGIGKSRLVAELRIQAQARGITSFLGSGSADEHATLYYVWRDIFSHMLDLNVLTEPSQRRRHLFDLLEDEPDLLELAPLLNTIMLLELPDNAVTAPLVGQARAERTREMLLMFLRRSTERSPKVIVLEDAHWLDSASWLLAVEVRRLLPRALLVISSRPIDPLPPIYQDLLNHSTARRMQLAALTAADSLELVCQRLGVRSLPPPIAALIREKAQGNPFFSEELISTLRDADYLTNSDGECVLTGDADALELLAFPDTVQGVISSRIDHLTPIQQLTLKVASVIGRHFDFATLCAIHPVERETAQIEAHLTILEQLQHTRIDLSEPDLAYTFKHVITQESGI